MMLCANRPRVRGWPDIVFMTNPFQKNAKI